MARILTGIQSSGRPHLGNLLGAIVPAIQLTQKKENESFLFIADLHSLTTIKDPSDRMNHINATAAAWLAFGLDTEKTIFYRQSRIPEVCELAWYLGCITPFPMLANAHSFKDKSDKLADVNAGLFTYPVLMTGDIILYDADYVPVGKDQKQHLEISRDIATAFNNQFGETFVVPDSIIDERIMVIPGTDGLKMSKSYGNTIDIFQPDKKLRKQVMSIITDSTPLEEPKNPDTCNVYSIYSLLANDLQIKDMRQNYEGGNYGYGHAKQALFELIVDTFSEEREKFNYFLDNPDELEKTLQEGEIKAREVAGKKMVEVRKKLGFSL